MKARFIILLVAIAAVLAGCSHYLKTSKLKFKKKPDIIGNYYEFVLGPSPDLIILEDFSFKQKSNQCKGFLEGYGSVKVYGNYVVFFYDSTIHHSFLSSDSIYSINPYVNYYSKNDSSIYLFYKNQLFRDVDGRYFKRPYFVKN